MSKWQVVSPEYMTMVPILDDGSGPMEYGCDVVEVEAATKRAAIVAGIREMRRQFRRGWHNWHCDPDTSPFRGMRAYPEEAAT